MPALSRVALLGAGHIGQTIARLLGDSGDYQVTVIDKNPAALARIAGRNVSTRVADTENSAALLAALRDAPGGGRHDMVVNALPYHLAVATATVALEAGCHYFDLTEDVAATREIKRLAAGAATAFMPQCGLAPGFIGILTSCSTSKRCARWCATMPMKPGASPHCGMKAVAAPAARRLISRVAATSSVRSK